MTRVDWLELIAMIAAGPLVVGFLWILWILVAAAVQ